MGNKESCIETLFVDNDSNGKTKLNSKPRKQKKQSTEETNNIKVDKFMMENPLIILLPISQYFNNFGSLRGVKYDTIANYRFWNQLGYEVFPSREDDRWYGKMFWTKTEIIQYFDNIIDTKLLNDKR
eukprot:468021_1